MAAATLPTDLDSLLDRVTVLRGTEREVRELEGGLTNRNLRVTTAEHDVVVRISRDGGDQLAIDRDAEYANSCAAAAAGSSPRVVEYIPDAHLLVVEYIDGTTLASGDLRDSDMLSRVANVCRTLHGGPPFVSDFDMFAVQDAYLRTVQRRGFRLPARYLEFVPQVSLIRRALSAQGAETVPCNNDLLAANFVDDGARLWIIDFEYAGNNDPCFELGNVWSEANLSLEHLTELVGYYFGPDCVSKVARARLLGLMSKYGWTLWASIQDATSQLDFDFWSWGLEKYDRAVDEFDGPDFDRLLATAAAG